MSRIKYILYACRSHVTGYYLLFSVVVSLMVPTSAWAECLKPIRPPNHISGETALVVQDAQGRDVQLYSRSVALLIGESNYPGATTGLTPLSSIPREIDTLRKILESHGFEVWTYLDLNSKQMQPTIDCFIREKLPRDEEMRFLLWYAGHGMTLHDGRKDGYLLPVDVRKLANAEAYEDEVRQKGVRLSQFIQWAANEVVAKHALFVFDSCFSGAVLSVPTRSGTIKTEKPQPPAYAISVEAQHPLREFLTAGTEDQEVPASSIFADYFVKALSGQRREADFNNDGLLTGTELVTFLKEVVSEESVKQTPTSGRLNDNTLNRGEMVFVLPARQQHTVSGGTSSPSLQPFAAGMRPVFLGALNPRDKTGVSIVQFLEAENYLTTKATSCSSNCDTPGKSNEYRLELKMPADAPVGALLDVPELRCISGPCLKGAQLLSGPVLSADRHTALTVLKGWGMPSTWRLAARVVTPVSGTNAAVVDRRSGTLQQVNAKSITVATHASEWTPAQDSAMQSVLTDLQSDDTNKRRAARGALAKLIGETSPDVVTGLIRRVPVGTYRYQLGVAEALADANNGWVSADAASRTILEKSFVRWRKSDRTVASTLIRALSNQRLFAYYEVGSDGWLTKDGQLRKIDQRKPPLASFDTLAAGDILRAASAVNLRAGVGIASGIVKTASDGQCMEVIRPDRGYLNASARGGWLQVRLLAQCKKI